MRLASISDQSLRCVVRSSLSILTMALSKPRLWKKMSSEELRLAHIWFDDDGKTPREIAELLHRDKWSAGRAWTGAGGPFRVDRKQHVSLS